MCLAERHVICMNYKRDCEISSERNILYDYLLKVMLWLNFKNSVMPFSAQKKQEFFLKITEQGM